jgi:peptidoglycan/LPS O-acetylase OafA/YrhL
MSRFVVMVVFVLLMSLLLKSKFVLFDELWTLKTAFKPLVVILSIALETAMLVFLYSTNSRKTKLLSILVLFLSYSAISVYSLLSETSCSCFGALEVSPLYILYTCCC